MDQCVGSATVYSKSRRWQLKGLVGSLDALLIAAVYRQTARTQLCIAHDPEEAAYIYDDLKNLLGLTSVLFYPASPQQPYAPTVANHADHLVRTETLLRLQSKTDVTPIIVTYPIALTDKVVHPKVLKEHTWKIQVGNKLTTTAVTQQLVAQGFEKKDFVYEAGQFAIRGGIVDVFGYAYSLPLRIELVGNIVESLRTFDPASQRSLQVITHASIIPQLSTLATAHPYQSLLTYLRPQALVWFKDYALVLDTLSKSYSRATQAFQEKIIDNNLQTLSTPDILWETSTSWTQALQQFTYIEFGTRFEPTTDEISTYQATALPPFCQNFTLLAEHLCRNQSQGLHNIITAASSTQFDRLQTLLEAKDTTVAFTPLTLGLRQGFVDSQVGISCYTDHQIFGRYYRYQLPRRHAKTQAFTPRALQTLHPGDYVVHLDYGIGRFAGLNTITTNGKQQEVIRLLYKDDDLVYVGLQSLHKIAKYTGKEGVAPTITKLGSSAWNQKKKKVKTKIKDIAKELMQLYSIRKQTPGFAFSPDNFLQASLESSFLHEETPDQAAAVKAVKKDMEAPYPMDRLICGDVGFGKTEIAIRAAFKAIHDNKQVAVLVPTTILTLQHYNSFCNRLEAFDVRVAYINRFKTALESKEILASVAAGKTQILIGTHRILSKNVQFSRLGLLIVDEEQKFGVQAKERLKQLRVNVDVLTLTATPIPRTLHFSLMGARDLSVITTPPPNRQPIVTSIHNFASTVIKDAIAYELQRGGQVFFVHNSVGDIEEVANMIHQLVPHGRIGVAHGQMPGSQLEQRMIRFIQGEYNILVATSIIESGLDIPNANTILINHSHLFGLSDLHQMRGRVGRSDKKAFCYLLAPSTSVLTAEARTRLRALEEFSDLGDGFKVAMRDLDIRGAGDLLGAAQSGFIADVGFDTYCKILDEAVQELKEGTFKTLFAEEMQEKTHTSVVADCTLETDLEALIPVTYVHNTIERISLYTRLDKLKDEAVLQGFQQELQDRFGPLPLPVQTLLQLVRLRWMAQKIGLSQLKLKNKSMRCYFSMTHAPQEKILERVVSYVQRYPQQCRMQEVKGAQLLLIIDQVPDILQAQVVLEAF
eukprot:CAMPEP_0116823184 /NCGR_PEP_ID=MMETSP0418-20121206/701_1 /TAXON_ID=1158023 /ORGANISM="Astrosyne radiata, Strain 13vi08-1A" /LENGTH=1098 /DNA_ID=CAMNT_0004451417 /DNA_START=2492 /DNA_END=5789 /DNA_ORIENTATION=-